jgi:hypothetical protein
MVGFLDGCTIAFPDTAHHSAIPIARDALPERLVENYIFAATLTQALNF